MNSDVKENFKKYSNILQGDERSYVHETKTRCHKKTFREKKQHENIPHQEQPTLWRQATLIWSALE